MYLIAVLPPFVQGNVCATDEGQGVVVHLTVERGQGLVDLSCKYLFSISAGK